MINHKLLCLVLLVFGFNLMNSQKSDYKMLLGIEHNDLVGDTIQLEKNTFIAFEKMRKAALKDGIKIKIVSGFRDFDRQKMIWNSKFKKFTKEYNLSAIDAINKPTNIAPAIEFGTLKSMYDAPTVNAVPINK